MKTAIIIPTVPPNSDVLKTCIDSIKKFFKKGTYEIIVELNDFEGYTTAINRGIRKGLKNKKFDGFLLGNDDIRVIEKECLEDMRKTAEENNGVAVPPSWYRTTHVAMGWCYFPRKVLEKIGMFDERYKMLECSDVDMSVRLLEKGYTLNAIKKEYVEHDGGKAKEKFTEKQNELVRRNRQIFKEKWKGTEYENVLR